MSQSVKPAIPPEMKRVIVEFAQRLADEIDRQAYEAVYAEVIGPVPPEPTCVWCRVFYHECR